ncbi:MAG: hypothetical protein QOG31_1892 [Thermoplasmata archaeon]|nr:hypothetical protein [Thermoplasmata archaeon]
MDLEERARAFMAALGGGAVAEVAALLADGAVYDVQGVGAMGKEAFVAYLGAVRARLPQAAFTVRAVVVRRNVTFVEWTRAPDAGQGVHVLSWDQDGRVAHATVHARSPVLGHQG